MSFKNYSHYLDNSFRFVDTPTRPQNIAAIIKFNNIIKADDIINKLHRISYQYKKLDIFELDPINYSNKVFELKEFNLIQDQDITNVMQNNNFTDNKKWKLFILNSLEENISYVIFKLHHSLADGISGLGFFHHLLFDLKNLKINRSDENFSFFNSIVALSKQISIKKINKIESNQESEKRDIILIDIPTINVKKFKSEHKVSGICLNLYVASRIFASIFPNRKNFITLVPIASRTTASVGILGNYIGGTALNIDLESNDLLNEINSISSSSINKTNLGGYILFSRILSLLPNWLSNMLGKFASNKIDAIVTTLNGPKKTTFDLSTEMISEYAIPALMPGQLIAFGFMKNINFYSISIVCDKSINVNKNEIQNIINSIIDR